MSGGGFAAGAASVRSDSEIWLLYGDRSSAYSLAEFDTYVRSGFAPIAVIGTDASRQQIARDQVTCSGAPTTTPSSRPIAWRSRGRPSASTSSSQTATSAKARSRSESREGGAWLSPGGRAIMSGHSR